MSAFTESVVEDAALACLEALGYSVLHGPEIAAGETGAERSDPNYRDVILGRRLLRRLFHSVQSERMLRDVVLPSRRKSGTDH